MPDPKLHTYRHTNCFVRDGGHQVQAVAVIRTTSAVKAAEAFGTTTDDLRKFGGRWKPGILGNGAGEMDQAEFTLDGGVTWWRSSLDSELERHPDVLYWHPIATKAAGEPERWFVGVDGAQGTTAPVRNLVAEAERAFMTILARAFGAHANRGLGLTVAECDQGHGHEGWKMARIRIDVSAGPAAVDNLTAFAAWLTVDPGPNDPALAAAVATVVARGRAIDAVVEAARDMAALDDPRGQRSTVSRLSDLRVAVNALNTIEGKS